MQDLTIAQHENEINDIEKQVSALRATQLQHHEHAERKRSLIPILPTDKDQVVGPGAEAGLLAWFAKLPKNLQESFKKKIDGGDN